MASELKGYQGKIFCIGFHKTGTRSLGRALTILGYKVHFQTNTQDMNIADNITDIIDNMDMSYDAFIDNPWALMFKRIDQNYPGNRYILSLRSTEHWIGSVVRYFGEKTTPMREHIYGMGAGSPVGNETIYIERYEQHNQEVMNYFSKRPNDLLVMNFENGDDWRMLCPFLDLPIPPQPFPHLNKTTHK